MKTVFLSAQWLFVMGVTVSSAIACGDDAITPMSGATSDASTASGATTSATTGAGGGTTTSSTSASSSSSGTGGGQATGVHNGSISVFSGASSMTTLHGYEANASFIGNSDGTAGVFTSATFGACALKTFTTLPEPGTKNNQSAGVITISGGTSPVTLAPGTANKYLTVEDHVTDLFIGGETISIDVAGADVPAFDTTLTAPATVDLQTPVEPAGTAPLPVDRTQDLHFTWLGTGAGHVLVVMDAQNLQLTCSFPSVDGSGTIPHGALAALQAQSTGAFAILPTETKDLGSGDYAIEVVVGTSFTWNGVVNPQTFSFQMTN